MKILIKKDRLEIHGHQSTSVLCAGISGIVHGFLLYYPDGGKIENGENRAEDKVTLYDNGTSSYRMVRNALMSLDEVEYNLTIEVES